MTKCWLDAIDAGDIEASICAHGLAELYNVLTRIPGGLSPRDTEIVVAKLASRAQVVPLMAGDYSTAISRCADRGIVSGGVFDALRVIAAERLGANVVLTFNPRDFERHVDGDGLRVVVPPDPPGGGRGINVSPLQSSCGGQDFRQSSPNRIDVSVGASKRCSDRAAGRRYRTTASGRTLATGGCFTIAMSDSTLRLAQVRVLYAVLHPVSHEIADPWTPLGVWACAPVERIQKLWNLSLLDGLPRHLGELVMCANCLDSTFHEEECPAEPRLLAFSQLCSDSVSLNLA